MSKLSKKIIISVIITAIFMTPFSGGIPGFRNRTVSAQTTTGTTMSVEKNNIGDVTASFKVTIKNTASGYMNNGATYTLYDKYFDPVTQTKPSDIKIIKKDVLPVTEKTPSQVLDLSFGNLTKQTKYFFTVDLQEGNVSTSYLTGAQTQTWKYHTESLVEFTTSSSNTSNDGTINTNKVISGNPSVQITTGAITGTTATTADYFDCSVLPLSDLVCKTANLLYFALFQPMAAFTWLAAKLLDFFVYYSTNSDSYGGGFVTKAWGAVRDIANIFFIIALLYVAIKTILGLNVSDNKKLVGTVIIIALIINFSLFTTKLVIDSSNILAKVFYNNITSVDESGKPLSSGSGGQKSVSVGLVKQFDPQNIFKDNNNNSTFKGHEGLFIFVTILSILLMGFMIYIFISISLLFVTRVVSLWLSMIFSPIAFASYTLPFEIPGFGHKEWWKGLFENAFLAPIFIFFLYVIVLFGDAMKNIPYDVSKTANDWGGYLDAAMKTIIPFVIIYILLSKAKKLAIKYSGEMGEGISKIGNMAGGLALGAITGGAAIAGRATIGRAGAAMANSGALKAAEARGGIGGGVAKQLRNFGKFTGSGSMDVRGIKVGGVGLSSNLGKPAEGGFTKRRAEQVKKRQERAKELEVGEDEGLKQTVRQREADLHHVKSDPIRQNQLLALNNGDPNAAVGTIANMGLGGLERALKASERVFADNERALKDATNNLTAVSAQYGANSNEANIARQEVLTATTNRDNAFNAKETDRTNLETRQQAIRTLETPIKNAENDLTRAQNAVIGENNERKHHYADTIQGRWSQTVNFITSGGQHSFAGEREAANKIRADVQEEKKISSH